MNRAFRRLSLALLRAVVTVALLMLALALSIARPLWTGSQTDTSDVVVSPAALREHVQYLSVDITDRSHRSAAGTKAAASYIEAQLLHRGGRVQRQTFTVNGESFDNVAADFGPDNGERIVVGAHYDAFDGLPGADDNASGVAGLIELATLLQSSELTRPITLVAYALEEPPHFATEHMGSAAHARSMSGRPIKLMICLEMIGYFRDEPGTQSYPSKVLGLIYPNRGDYIAIIDQYWANDAVALKSAFNRYTSLPAYSVNAPSALPGIDYSDHRNYWQAGIPAVMVTDTAFYRNPNYHTAGDVVETLDYAKMAEVVRGVYHFVMEQQLRD